MELVAAHAVRKGILTSLSATSVETAIPDILIVTSVIVQQKVSPNKYVTQAQGCVIVHLKELEEHNVTVVRQPTLTILSVRRLW